MNRVFFHTTVIFFIMQTSISEASGGGSSLVYLVPMLGILIVGVGIAYYLS